VNWDLPQEAKQALELLGKWRPMDVEDSLELLSSQFTNPTVRRYAVARLQQADDEVKSTVYVFLCLYVCLLSRAYVSVVYVFVHQMILYFLMQS